MKINGLKIRYINFACYEIVLPNGKVIVVDPCINMPANDKVISTQVDFKPEQFTGADYQIISHAHADHTLEVGYLAEKFDSKIICGAMSAMSIAKSYNLKTSRVYPVFPNEELEMEDFNIKVFRGKHTFSRKEAGIMNSFDHPNRPDSTDDEILAGVYGSMEYCDYLITTKQNVRILITGGQPNWFYFTNMDAIAKQYAPNIVIKQSSSKYTPEEYGRHMASYGAQLIMPLHQDGLSRSPIDCTPAQWFERAQKELDRIGSPSKLLNPEPFKWYNISMGVEIEE